MKRADEAVSGTLVYGRVVETVDISLWERGLSVITIPCALIDFGTYLVFFSVIEYFEHAIDAGRGYLFSIPSNNVTAIPGNAGHCKNQLK